MAVLSLPLAILPAYRTPPLILPDDVPATARIDPIITDERFRLLGVETSPTTMHPGDAFDLTLYWQAMQPASSNASCFCPSAGARQRGRGAVDTYPGWGNFATSLWPVDSVIVDRYRLSIPYTLTTPTLSRSMWACSTMIRLALPQPYRVGWSDAAGSRCAARLARANADRIPPDLYPVRLRRPHRPGWL